MPSIIAAFENGTLEVPHHFHHEGKPIVMIEYHPHGKLWMPHQVFVSHAPKYPGSFSDFSFDWCKRDASLFYHESGGGGRVYLNGWPNAKRTHAKLWWNHELAPDLRTGGGDAIPNLASYGFERLRAPIKLGGDDFNPFTYGYHGEVVYCMKCKDHLPEEGVCEHIFWCDRCEEWGGAEGNKERCRHRKPSLD